MEKKNLVGLATLSLIAILGISFVAAAPFGKSFFDKELSEEERATVIEEMQQMRMAVENEDYETWKNMMNERISMMQQQINEETFAEVVARHNENSELREAILEARESGDLERIHDLRDEIRSRGQRQGFGFHR